MKIFTSSILVDSPSNLHTQLMLFLNGDVLVNCQNSMATAQTKAQWVQNVRKIEGRGSFSFWNTKLTPNYEPAIGTYTRFYNGRILFFVVEKKTPKWQTPTIYYSLKIITFGWSDKPIRKLIEDAVFRKANLDAPVGGLLSSLPTRAETARY